MSGAEGVWRKKCFDRWGSSATGLGMPTFWFVSGCILYNSFCYRHCCANWLEKLSVKSMFWFACVRASGLYTRKYRYEVAGAVTHLKRRIRTWILKLLKRNWINCLMRPLV